MATSRTTSILMELPSILYEEPERLEDGMVQQPVINEIVGLLMPHYRGRSDVFASNAGLIFYDSSDTNRRIAPDLCIAFDVDVEAIYGIRVFNYVMWDIGKPPDFVMEVASPSTANNDLGPKRELYERLGIQEYWRLDSTPGSELYGRPLVGERLVDGRYQPYELHTAEDGTLWSHSEVLNLRFHWGLDLFEQFDVRDETGRTINREVREREARLAEREARLTERLAAEARESIERDARLAAEARVSDEREARLAERLAAEARESLEREARLAERVAAEARERELLAEIERLRRRRD